VTHVYVLSFIHAQLRKKHKDSNLILLGNIKAVYGVLDAFVTARTLRNRKSTRGSKSVELLHTLGSGKAVGARVKLFFLDGSRVISRRRGEENFSVLYQVRAHAKSNAEFADVTMLRLAENQDSPYLSNTGTPTVGSSAAELTREEENDSLRWERLVEHMTVDLGVTNAAMECIARLLATVLNLGCVRFIGPESVHLYEPAPSGAHGDETIELVDIDVVRTISAQLGINADLLVSVE
jgi:myosin heavy subunit